MIKLGLFLCVLMASTAHAQSWHFDVYLDKTKIGKHTFDLTGNTLNSKAVFDVKVFFINAYHYDHQANEKWQDNCLQDLSAKTDDNGKEITVSAQQNGQQFSRRVNQKSEPAISQQCVMTFAYWNPEILTQKQLLNPQNAEYLETDIRLIGTETIKVKNQPVETTHYRILGSLSGKQKLNIDVWYNQEKEWVQLKSTTFDGDILTYKLI